MLAELLAEPGVEEHLTLDSRFGFMALHGGSLESGTAEIAMLAAEVAGASLYAVLQPAELRWHIPSRLIDPEESDALSRFVDHVDVVISVHGYGREDHWRSLLVGGANRELAATAATTLRAALPEYRVIDDLDAIPEGLRGLHPCNPVNRPRGAGVQLELPPRVRQEDNVDRGALITALAALAA